MTSWYMCVKIGKSEYDNEVFTRTMKHIQTAIHVRASPIENCSSHYNAVMIERFRYT